MYEREALRALGGVRQDETLRSLLEGLRRNDDRLVRALLGFARERALEVRDVEAALAVLELADAALRGKVRKDVCARVAANLLDEACDELLRDQRFDRYFISRCASSAARLATRAGEPDSLRDVTEVIRAATALARVARPPSDAPEHAAAASRELAAQCIREALGSAVERTVPGLPSAVGARARPEA
jgi:hypothetical protein